MTGQSETEASRQLRGIGLMAVTVVTYSVIDTITKYLSAETPAVFILWGRFIFQIATMAALLARSGSFGFLRTRRPGLHLLRGLLNVGSNFAFIFGLTFMPLADAVALHMVGPLFVTALSVPLLGEKVGVRRWVAVGIGFLGAMIVIRPGLGVTHWAGSLLLLSAMIYALFQIVTRKMTTEEQPLTMLFYTTMTGFAVTSALVPFFWVDAPLGTWAFLAVQGGLGTTANVLLIAALSFAPVSILAPFSYGVVVMATILGYVVFGRFPDQWTLIGGAVIVASGLYVIHRENMRRRPS